MDNEQMPATTSYEEHLRSRAQALLNLVIPDGAPAPVVEDFLRGLEAIMTERRDVEAWGQRGLGGARWTATYPDSEGAAEAVQYLMGDGHGHHFAVLGEGHSLVVSEMAAECLRSFHAHGAAAAETAAETTDWGTP